MRVPLKVDLSPFSLFLRSYHEKLSQVVTLQTLILGGSSFIGGVFFITSFL